MAFLLPDAPLLKSFKAMYSQREPRAAAAIGRTRGKRRTERGRIWATQPHGGDAKQTILEGLVAVFHERRAAVTFRTEW